jgi:hypothetical protein
MKSVTISVKVPAALKRKLGRYRIKVSEVVRGALEQEVLKAEERAIGPRLEKVSSQLSKKLSREDIVMAVRAGREEK